jgi:hypothetical protein
MRLLGRGALDELPRACGGCGGGREITRKEA